MPTEISATSTHREIQTVRLATGIGLVFGIGHFIGWRMAFVAPILATLLLKSPSPPTVKAGIGLVLVIVATFGVTLVVTLPLLQFPLPAMLVTALGLYWAFYLGQLGAPPFTVLMLLVALTLVPVLGLESIDLSFDMAVGLVQAGLMAVLFAWLAFALVPAPGLSASQSTGVIETPPDRKQAIQSAWRSTVIIIPVLILFLNFGLSAYILVLVMIALLVIQPDLTTGLKGGIGLIAGNIIGGAIAIVIYELTVILPNLLFLTLLITLVCLLLGPQIFAGGVAGSLCSTALTTVLLIVGMTVSPIGPEADAKFYGRIIQIAAAVLYVGMALLLIDSIVGYPKKARTLP